MTRVVAVVTGVLVAVVALLRWRFLVIRVAGDSMAPTLPSGVRVLVRRARLHGVRPGQVVVLAGAYEEPGPSTWIIKRVLAVPGDPVPRAEIPALRDVAGHVVPPRRFVVVGDNAAGSYDSRRAGYVTADGLVGVVVRTMNLPSGGRT